MFQILIEDEVIMSHCESEEAARVEAIEIMTRFVIERLGSRFLTYLPGGVLTWETIESNEQLSGAIEIQEMLGIWIETEEGEYWPERDYGMDDDDERVLFKTEEGRICMGTYDAADCTFCDTYTDKHYQVEEVVAWLVVPECDF